MGNLWYGLYFQKWGGKTVILDIKTFEEFKTPKVRLRKSKKKILPRGRVIVELREMLRNGPVARDVIADRMDELEIEWRTVESAKAELGVISERAGGNNWVWRLPDAEIEAIETRAKDGMTPLVQQMMEKEQRKMARIIAAAMPGIQHEQSRAQREANYRRWLEGEEDESASEAVQAIITEALETGPKKMQSIRAICGLMEFNFASLGNPAKICCNEATFAKAVLRLCLWEHNNFYLRPDDNIDLAGGY